MPFKKSDKRTASKSPSRRSRSRSRSRSRGRSKSPARTKPKASPSPSRRSPARNSRSKAEKTPGTPTRTSARIAQKEVEKEKQQTETKVELKLRQVTKSPKKATKEGESSSVSTLVCGLCRSFAATVGIIFFPFLTVALTIACSKSSCSYKNLLKLPRDIDVYFNKEFTAIFFGYAMVQAAIMYLPLGPIVQGFPNSKGKRLSYRCNGFYNFMAVMIGIAFASYMKFSFAFILQHLIHVIVARTIFSFLVGLYLYFKAAGAAAHEKNPDGQSGCIPQDFLVGREINPRWREFDFKFYAIRMCMISWAMLDIAFVLESQNGKLNLPLVAVASFQLFIIADCFWFEEGILATNEVKVEGMGFQYMFMATTFVPFVWSLQCRFLADHPQAWSYPTLAGFAVLFLVGYIIFRGSNSQKYQFRKNPNDPALSHLETIPSPSGKKLLVSGWWGLVRHPNYLGDILITLAWTLPCGFDHILPYIQLLFVLVSLVYRVYTDDAWCRKKHGTAWDRYCQRVKYRLIPYVF